MITSKNLSIFSIARKVSQLSDFKKRKAVHIGCVVLEGSRVVSTGYNSTKTSPLQKKCNRGEFIEESPHCNHAEVKALAPLINSPKYDIDFSKVKLYTYREKADGSLGLSRPCRRCMSLIKELGIKQIFYTTEDGYCEERIDYSDL